MVYQALTSKEECSTFPEAISSNIKQLVINKPKPQARKTSHIPVTYRNKGRINKDPLMVRISKKRRYKHKKQFHQNDKPWLASSINCIMLGLSMQQYSTSCDQKSNLALFTVKILFKGFRIQLLAITSHKQQQLLVLK